MLIIFLMEIGLLLRLNLKTFLSLDYNLQISIDYY